MKIHDTIRKLLALSQSSNENEAQAALLKAQELLAKYHFNLDEIKDQEEIDHEVIEEDADKKAHRTPWKRSLAKCIANNFRCESYFRGYDTYSTIFVGKQADIDVCKEVYSAAIRFIDFYFKEYWRAHNTRQRNVTYRNFNTGEEYTRTVTTQRPISEAIREKSSYAYGFISALQERFKEQEVKAEKEGWGLVLVKDADVTAYMDDLRKGFSKRTLSSGSMGSSSAFSQGYTDGKENFGDTGLRKVR